jgi:hypothetical protein
VHSFDDRSPPEGEIPAVIRRPLLTHSEAWHPRTSSRRQCPCRPYPSTVLIKSGREKYFNFWRRVVCDVSASTRASLLRHLAGKPSYRGIRPVGRVEERWLPPRLSVWQGTVPRVRHTRATYGVANSHLSRRGIPLYPIASFTLERAAASVATGNVLFVRSRCPMTNVPDPIILTTKSVLMQRCADLARSGYVLHTQGVVSLDRAAAIVRKFRDHYLVHSNKDARYRRKRSGIGNAHLLLWHPDYTSHDLTFVLLVSAAGDHPAKRLEMLKDARERGQRLEITGYELLQMTRAGARHPGWTWRMMDRTYQGWRDRVLDAVRHRDDLKLRQAWYSIHRVPGFAPARAQAKKIIRLVRAEWSRTRAVPFPFSELRVLYIRRLPTVGLRLSTLLAHHGSRVTNPSI